MAFFKRRYRDETEEWEEKEMDIEPMDTPQEVIDKLKQIVKEQIKINQEDTK
jgi:hypothetical protein